MVIIVAFPPGRKIVIFSLCNMSIEGTSFLSLLCCLAPQVAGQNPPQGPCQISPQGAGQSPPQGAGQKRCLSRDHFQRPQLVKAQG